MSVGDIDIKLDGHLHVLHNKTHNFGLVNWLHIFTVIDQFSDEFIQSKYMLKVVELTTSMSK